MVTLWFTKIKLGLDELSSVPERYYEQVLTKLVDSGLYNEEGNPIVQD